MGEVIVNLGRFGQGMLPALQAVLPDERLVGWPTEAVPADPEILATLVTDRATIEAALLPGVRWIHVLGAGVDGFPLDAVGDRVLTCSRGAGAVAIAEWVLAMILAVAKDLPRSWISEPPAQWNQAQLGALEGATLGLIGVGAIGTEVARRALAFDMRVLATRRTATGAPLPGVSLTTLAEVLAGADHLVIAAPATAETRHLLGRQALAEVKPGVHVVNIARGSLVDQDALREALDDGRVAAASLDVVDPEPLPAGHWLYSHPGVRLSPHVSWSSPHTGRRTLELFVDNVGRYRTGAPLHGSVDVRAGY